MIISHSRKFLFVHNYKVAGTSLRNALAPWSSKKSSKSRLLAKFDRRFRFHSKSFPQHSKASLMKKELPEKLFVRYYKFGFVRNPYDWQLSLYHYMLKKKTHRQHELAKSFRSFTEYLYWRVENEPFLQKSFFFDPQGNNLMNFIGRYERLNADFEKITAKIGVSAELPMLNASRDGRSYLDQYTPTTEKMIYDCFKEDFDTFGYEREIL